MDYDYPGIRLIRSFSLVVLAFLIPLALVAQQPVPAAPAPLPPQILNAKKIFISNGGGDNAFYSLVDDGPNRAYNQFYADTQRWGRYQPVSTPTDADLVFEISAVAPVSGIDVTNGTGSASYALQLRLRIIDPKTQSRLWSMTANLSLSGLKKSRDEKFDAGVLNLVNQVK